MAQSPFDLPAGYGGIGAGEPPLSESFTGQAEAPPAAPPQERRRPRFRRLKWALYLFLVSFVLLAGWLAAAVPVSRTAQPLVPPQIVLESADGTPIARTGAVMAAPVELEELPPYVVDAFLAIEDRRFFDHFGVDPVGIGRAMWSNAQAGAARQGGSTITQQLAKLTYLTSDRTLARKLKEVPIALWLEAWLTKEEILERYLSNVYFGDNVYGLRAASLHYFYRRPENLTLTQAAMLAGLLKAPSRLAPTRNPQAAGARERVVLAAMADAGFLTGAQARDIEVAQVDHRPPPPLPRGTYFADWARPQARAGAQVSGYETAHVRTTLDRSLQALAQRVTRAGAPDGAQVALVAMRPNGEVVAMVGGRDYGASPFNRAVQARRQPGSTFKLVVYLAALRSGLRPETIVEDSPIESGNYRPTNFGGRYRGRISLEEAFAHSSNVVAVRLYRQLGAEAVADAARALGIDAELPANASVALGSAGVSLLELTAAYAAVAGEHGPVDPHAVARPEPTFLQRLFGDRDTISGRERADLRALLAAAVNDGTGRAARLAIPAFGKTGTSQDSRDALFVGFAGDLVVGVWIGKDDNAPLGTASGGGAPARIWRDFVAGAIPGAAPRPPAPRRIPEPAPFELPYIVLPGGASGVEGAIGGIGIRIGRDGVTVDSEAVRRRIEEIERRADEVARSERVRRSAEAIEQAMEARRERER